MKQLVLVIMLTGACRGPDVWQVSTAAGKACAIRRGWSAAEVHAACGPSSAKRIQMKVLYAADGGGYGACSAPADVYGALAVLYACDGGVYRVAPESKLDLARPEEIVR